MTRRSVQADCGNPRRHCIPWPSSVPLEISGQQTEGLGFPYVRVCALKPISYTTIFSSQTRQRDPLHWSGKPGEYIFAAERTYSLPLGPRHRPHKLVWWWGTNGLCHLLYSKPRPQRQSRGFVATIRFTGSAGAYFPGRPTLSHNHRKR